MIFTRGSIGTHLFELAYAIGKHSIKTNSSILNFHSIRDCESHAKKTNVSKLIANFRISTLDVPSRRKQGCFTKENFPECMESFFQITDGGFEGLFSQYPNIEEIGHIRMPDILHSDRDSLKIVENLEKIQQKYKEQNVKAVISNDPKLKSIDVGGTAQDDFKLMVNASKIVGTYSLFSLATLLFKVKSQKEKKLILMMGDETNKHVKNDLQQILKTRLSKQIVIENIIFK
jgi:hypothetical protein